MVAAPACFDPDMNSAAKLPSGPLAPQSRPRVAILEDDPQFRRLLQICLRSSFSVIIAADGTALERLVVRGAIDVILLDIGLPGPSGLEIARTIRAASQIPILFLTGNDADDMVVTGLNLGADDYLTKPVRCEVLQARIRNALRRHAAAPAPATEGPLRIGDLQFDFTSQSVTSDGEGQVSLTEMEALILAVLAAAGPAGLSRSEMHRRIHGREWDNVSREIDVHVCHLRRKLARLCGDTNPLRSIRGVGYRLATFAEPTVTDKPAP